MFNFPVKKSFPISFAIFKPRLLALEITVGSPNLNNLLAILPPDFNENGGLSILSTYSGLYY